MNTNEIAPTEHLDTCVTAVIALLDEGEDERTGGYCTILERDDTDDDMELYQICTVRFGEVPEGKAGKYMSYSLEKATRLHHLPDDTLSWQSRDPGSGKWGGAIRTKTSIFSFSGLPELADEAAMLFFAILMKELTPDAALQMAEISDNHYYRKLAIEIPELQVPST